MSRVEILGSQLTGVAQRAGGTGLKRKLLQMMEETWCSKRRDGNKSWTLVPITSFRRPCLLHHLQKFFAFKGMFPPFFLGRSGSFLHMVHPPIVFTTLLWKLCSFFYGARSASVLLIVPARSTRIRWWQRGACLDTFTIVSSSKRCTSHWEILDAPSICSDWRCVPKSPKTLDKKVGMAYKGPDMIRSG